MWWATVGPSFIEESRKAGTSGTAAFYTGPISSDIIWYGMVTLTVYSGKKLINDSAVVRYISYFSRPIFRIYGKRFHNWNFFLIHISLNSYKTDTAATIPAVSALKILPPKETEMAPFSTASNTSCDVNPPTGPITISTLDPFID
ncbi:MAG TPA: hypothetical protein DEP04_07195 [Dehalococcoidia bacterium]|nr:hypothetical protein [Chloroflexota bacterium]HCE76399.1 hypothetical protein [Dehalococcoidia bacterium]